VLFNSFRFLIFFPCVFLLYYGLPFRYRKYMLLAASYYFYMCWKAEFIVLILISTAIDYFCGLGIAKYGENRRFARAFLAVSMCMNLGLLFFFKYLNFFGETLTALCQAVSIPFSAPALDIILPVGISFYTFQTMSYTIDVYRGKIKAERDFVTFALFVSYFPQLVAGPIEKAANLLPQLKKEHPFSYENASYGLKLMAWGFFKKLVVADRLAALFVDPVYQNPSNYYGGVYLLATAAFAFQVYCDFGGYSDIARGCAKTMGVDLMVNFKAPYLFSTSISDYWQRNHISLSQWFHEYVYISLGGNRKGPWKKALFITVTFFLSGLWHGADWTFVVWGLLQALYLNLENLKARFYPDTWALPQTPAPVLVFCRGLFVRLFTFGLCCFSLIFFRANTMSDALHIIRFSISGGKKPLEYIKNTFLDLYPGTILLTAVLLSLLLLFLFDVINEHRDAVKVVSSWPAWVRWPVYVSFLVLLCLLIPKETAAPFIYFQF